MSTKLHRAFQLFPVRPRPFSAATCCGGERARADGWPSSRKENGKDCRWIENGLWKFGERPENMENVLFRAAVRRRSRISIFFGGARRDSIPIIVLRDLRVRIVVDEFPDMRIFFQRRVVVADIPQVEVLQDLSDDRTGLENRYNPHLILTIGTAKRIDFVDFLNQHRPSAAELFRRHFSGRDRRYRIVGFRFFSHPYRLVRV